MKLDKINIIVLIASLAFLTNSCDKGLEELNVNPAASQIMTYDAQLLNVQLTLTGSFHQNSRGLLTQAAGFVQHVASEKTEEQFPGGKYYEYNNITDAVWITEYPSVIKQIVDLVNRTSENPEDVNYNAIARIVKVLAFHRLTDQYGDIPYSEAGQGIIGDNVTPKYDTQESIYMDMLGELETSAAALTDSQPSYEGSDNYYAGDLSKWRKFAYSLMLRLGMRLSEINPAAAQTWVGKALAGGVFESNEDNCYSSHDNIYSNGTSRAFSSNSFYKLSATLVDFLRDTDDPRYEMYGTVRLGDGPPKGLPNDIDATTISTLPAPNELDTFSTFRDEFVTLDAPMLYITYAEVLLMQAEAAVRGWGPGDAETLYNAAVHAGMTQWSIYGIDVPDAATIDTYLAANPFDSNNALENIGTEYWVTTYMNWYETWSNWRRTGYPQLVPVVYNGGTNVPGIIPTRFSYPDNEYSLNTDNINEAVSRLRSGEQDNFNSTVWWDVSQTN